MRSEVLLTSVYLGKKTWRFLWWVMSSVLLHNMFSPLNNRAFTHKIRYEPAISVKKKSIIANNIWHNKYESHVYLPATICLSPHAPRVRRRSKQIVVWSPNLTDPFNANLITTCLTGQEKQGKDNPCSFSRGRDYALHRNTTRKRFLIQSVLSKLRYVCKRDEIYIHSYHQ